MCSGGRESEGLKKKREMGKKGGNKEVRTKKKKPLEVIRSAGKNVKM